MSDILRNKLRALTSTRTMSESSEILLTGGIWNDTATGRYVIQDYTFCQELGISSDDAIHTEAAALQGWLQDVLTRHDGAGTEDEGEPVYVWYYQYLDPGAETAQADNTQASDMTRRLLQLVTEVERGEIDALAFAAVGSQGGQSGWLVRQPAARGSAYLLLATVGVLEYQMKAGGAAQTVPGERSNG